MQLFLDRITFPQELGQKVAEFSAFPKEYDATVLANKWNSEAQKGLLAIQICIEHIQDWHAESIKHAIHETLETEGIKMGKVMQMLRVALSGNGAGPDLMISMELWGKQQVAERLSVALAQFPKLSE